MNPFGWRALWQPFDYALHLRHELMYRTISELKPVDWRRYATTALPVLVGGWIAIAAWRALRRRFDPVELLLGLGFTTLALSAQRFLGFYALAATPFLMRGLGEWVSERRWPAWTTSPWVRAALAAAVCVGAGLFEWRRPDLPLGIGLQWERYPVRACDFIEANVDSFRLLFRETSTIGVRFHAAERQTLDRTQVPVESLKSSATRPSNTKPFSGAAGSANFIASPMR